MMAEEKEEAVLIQNSVLLTLCKSILLKTVFINFISAEPFQHHIISFQDGDI